MSVIYITIALAAHGFLRPNEHNSCGVSANEGCLPRFQASRQKPIKLDPQSP